MDGFVPSRNLERWEYPAGTRDPFARETFYLGGWWSPQSFFRSRKNLIEKGYLEPYTVNAGQYDEHRGHRLTDKAVRKFLSGDRSRVIQPGLAVPLLAGESARPVPEGEEFDDLREIVNQARGC